MMKVALAAVALLGTVGALGAAVVDLTDATFDAETAKGDWFVKFYAPWCGHCKRMTPTWEALAESTELAEADKHIAKVDCTVENALCERFGVTGFPTLKVISAGKLYDYNGERTEESLKSFITSVFETTDSKPAPKKAVPREGPSDVIEITPENFEAKIGSGTGTPWLLKLYAPWCGHCKSMAPAYEELATALKGEVNVAEADCDKHNALGRRFNIRGFPTVVLVRNGQVYKHKGPRTVEGLTEFVQTGWEEVDPTPLPGEPGLVTKEDFEQIWALTNRLAKKHVWIVVASAFIVGICFGAVLFGGSSQPPQRRRQAEDPKAKKNQ
jgi:protein disulfide-isomerase-like protein